MKYKIDINTFERKDMYSRFINYSNPIGSITATIKINNLIKYKNRGHKLNALLNYCILKVCQQIKEFHYYQDKDGLYFYDDITMMGVTFGSDKHLYLANWKFYENYLEFEDNYIKINKEIFDTNKSNEFSNTSIVSSSAFIAYPIDSAVVEMGNEIYHTYFTWGGYKKSFLNYNQAITVRFHHAFFDGGHISLFFKLLQKEINNLKI